MAFRRTSRRTFRRRPFRRGRPLARVRRTWDTTLNTTQCCVLDVTINPCGEGCENATDWKLVILDNAELQSRFSDQARVARVLGDLWFAPTMTTPPADLGDIIQAISSLGYWSFFAGIRKEQVDNTGSVLPVFPLANDHDFSESQWLKTWNYEQYNSSGQLLASTQLPAGSQLNLPVQCGDVHTTGAPDNILSSGSGTIDIETDCTTPNCFGCAQPELFTVNPSTRVIPSLLHLHVDFKRKVSLRENEQLSLQMAAAFPFVDPAIGPVMQWFGRMKTLLEY